MNQELENARKLYSPDPEVIPRDRMRPGMTVTLASDRSKRFGVVDASGPLIVLETESGDRIRAGWRSLRLPEEEVRDDSKQP